MRLPLVTCCVLAVLQAQSARPPASAQVTGTTEAQQVLTADAAWAGADVLLPMAASSTESMAAPAVRALGRLEDPALVPDLLSLLDSRSLRVRGQAALAIAQSLKNVDPASGGDLVDRVLDRLVISRDLGDASAAAPIVTALGRLVCRNEAQLDRILAVFDDVLVRTGNSDAMALREAVTRSFESLARHNQKLIRFQPETVKRLADIIVLPGGGGSAQIRQNAFAALIAGHAVDADSERAALQDDDPEVRRLAVMVLNGAGGGLDPAVRQSAIQSALSDRSALVRYEAVSAYSRRVAPELGCDPLLATLRDDSPHVVLAALDALGTLCGTDEAVTNRLVAESRTPPTIGSWQREAHAFVSLARRASDRAAISMSGFASHPVWEVRMYAARAAAAMHDLVTLERLAYDSNDNVREATIGLMAKSHPDRARTAAIAALDRADYQLVRSAALLLKDQPHDRALAPALLGALSRITKEAKDTSRDIRLALLEALATHAERDDARGVEALLTDFDPKVAQQAALTIREWTGTAPAATPRLRPRAGVFEHRTLDDCVRVSMAGGGSFRLMMLPNEAPVTVDRFLTLALRDHYYDGLTFHRVVPNFVIQGGSPGANEYSGAANFMRDEIAASNLRGTVGLSTRGRNTGDAQIFVNLVDNRRLDGDYTVFARVNARDMAAVDAIQEGDAIASIRLTGCRGL